MVVVEHPPPRVEQVPHAVLHAADPFLALVVLGESLLLDPVDKRVEQPRFEGGPHVAKALHASRRRERRFDVPCQGHERAGEPAIERAGRERRHAGRLTER